MKQPVIPVLLIEDNQGDVLLIREMLSGRSELQFEILEAGRLSTGLEILHRNPPGIVLLDLSLPDSSGLDTVRKVLAKCPGIPVIVFTGLNDEKLGVDAVIRGAQDYLVKGETDSRILIKAIKYAVERKRVEAALQEKERLLSESQQIAHIGSYRVDLSDNRITWSDEMFRIYGVDRDKFPLRLDSFLELICPDDRHIMTKWIEQAIAGLHPAAIEFRIVVPGGKERWILGDGDLITDASGEPVQIVGTALDITDRKLSELQRKLFATILTTLNRPNEWPHLIRDILQQIKDFTGIEAIGIRLKEGKDYPYFEFTGFPGDFIKAENYLCSRNSNGEIIVDSTGNPMLECMCGNIIQGRFDPTLTFFTEGGSFWTNSTTKLLAETSEAERQGRTRNRCNGEGYESVALIPVRSGDEVIGLLQLNDRRQNQFTQEPIRFLEEIGETIGIGFQRIKKENEIREAEERFRTLFDNLIIGVYRTAPDGRILVVNPSLLRMLGFRSMEELKQRNLETDGFEPGYERAKFKKNIETDGKIIGLESAWKRADGSVIFVRESASIVRDDAGNIRWYEGTVEDITEKKHSEEAVRQSEAKYREIFTHAPVGICQVTPGGEILSTNQALADILGYKTPEGIVKLKMTRNLYWDPSASEEIQHLIETSDTVQHLEILWKRKDGTPVWISLTAHAIRDDRGNSLYFEGFITDITERKMTEEILNALNAASMNIQRALTRDEIFTGILQEIHSLGGHCTVLSLDATQQTVYPKYTSYESGLIRPIERILRIKLADFAIPVQEITEFQEVIGQRKTVFIQEPKALAKKIKPQAIQVLIRKAFDLVKMPRFILAPMIENDRVFGVLSVQSERLSEKDIPAVTVFAHQMAAAWNRTGMVEMLNQEIRERQKAQGELIQAKEKAEESDRLKTSLLNNLSHEFRTPMNAILGFSALLESETIGDPELHQMAFRINTAGNRLMRTLDDILELSQLQAGIVPGENNEADLYELLVENLPGYREAAGRKNLNLKLKADSKPLVSMTAEHLSRVLYHLIGNAIKFTQEGSITIGISTVQEGSVPWVTLTIKDTGIGISPENLELIFEAFRQASEGYGRTHEGTGLGLTIAKRIVEAYGGVILVESNVGSGSTFTARLPLAGSAEKPEPVVGFPPQEERVLPDTEQNRPGIPPTRRDTLRILAVEDNENNVEVIRMFLEKQAMIDVAYNGEVAVERCRSHPFDLILMDIHLGPGKNGLDATREIRNIPGYQFTPIIAVTGYTLSADKERIFEAGCTHYLRKPFTRSELIHILKEAVTGPPGQF